MTWMQALGGPISGQWLDIPKRSHRYAIPILDCPETVWTPDFDPVGPRQVAPKTVLYEIRQLVKPGFRVPVPVLVAPGVVIHPVSPPYDSSWPNPLVPARCRCSEVGYPWIYQSGLACHLDHCPTHGLWRSSTTVRLGTSRAARDKWLENQGGKAAGTGVTLREAAPEPVPNRAHTP